MSARFVITSVILPALSRFFGSTRRLLSLANWRKPLSMAMGLLLINITGVVLLMGWGMMNGRATASSASPVPVPQATIEQLRLQVKSVQFEPTLAGEKIILNLANRLPEGFSIGENPKLPSDFQFSDATPGQATLSFSGVVHNLHKPLQRPYETPNLKMVYLESHLGKVQLFIKRANPGTAKLILDKPQNRLIIHVQNYAGKMLSDNSPYPGMQHREILQYTARGPLRIHVLEVDPKRLEVLPVIADGRMGAKANVSTMIQDVQGVAGINASFFKQDAGIPIGTVILNDELVSGPLFERVCFGIDQQNRPHMAQLSLHGSITIPSANDKTMPPVGNAVAMMADAKTVNINLGKSGAMLPIHNVNQPRIHPAQTVIYTDRWGAHAPGVPSNGMQVLLVQGHVRQVSSDKPISIPRGGLVVSGPMSAAMAQLATLPPEATVQTSFYTKPDWAPMKHAISGGPYLVRKGQRYIDLRAQGFNRGLGSYEPRTALGIKSDGHLLLVAVDGRVKQSGGLQLWQLSQLMQELGSVEAMNLDGGSSTQMVLNGRTLNANAFARVSTAIVVRPMTPMFSSTPIASHDANAPSIAKPQISTNAQTQ